MNECLEIHESGCPIGEDADSDHRLFGDVYFVRHKSSESNKAQDQRYKSFPVIPRINYTSLY